jgi:hypothetical protein
MSGSSILVTLNAMRARAQRSPEPAVANVSIIPAARPV